MPSFLIVHSQPPGGRADLFAQPPMLDVSGFGARLDWGDTTLEVPPGDHRVTISVAPVAGGREGAVVTVRVLPETGTRISFAPPATPGQPSTLRVDGQWPADAAMAYYAARDQRPFSPVAHQQPSGQPQAGAPARGGPQPSAFAQRTPQGQQPGVARASNPSVQPWVARTTPGPPMPAVPPVGPSVGSTGSVPIVAPPSSAPTFGQVQGAVVMPGRQQPHAPAPPQPAAPALAQQPQPAAPAPAPHPASPHQPGRAAPSAFGPGAPQHPPVQPDARPAFGHQPIVHRDVYGRGRVEGDRSAPTIPTPRQFEDFARAERDRHQAEAMAASRHPQGWYPDPYARAALRWHDGERWTASVMRGGRREHDPV